MTQNKRELEDASPHASLALQVPMPCVAFVPRNSLIPTLPLKPTQVDRRLTLQKWKSPDVPTPCDMHQQSRSMNKYCQLDDDDPPNQGVAQGVQHPSR
jgi:hypothetical protein